MSGNDVQTQTSQAHAGLNPHRDARAIVRLLQCPQCSYPFRQPTTLPCGYSLCKECVPPLFKRENITPLMPGRSEAFVCPFKDCELLHALSDCSLDITLNKIVEVIKSSPSLRQTEGSTVSLRLDEQLHWPNIVDSAMDVMPRSGTFQGGRISSTYALADKGELNYHSDVAYQIGAGSDEEEINTLDVTCAANLAEIVRGEVECRLCYTLMLDPLTTACGHTFCRQCVARALDHSALCPICRQKQDLSPDLQFVPSNKAVSNLISGLLPDLLQARIALAQTEDATDEEARMPLFPCSLAYPSMSTFLHIFEPRYRLMTRRAWDSGSRRFGMLGHNSNRQAQGNLGYVPFLQYGTVLEMQRRELFPDGRSLIESVGLYRFRILEVSMLDGYLVGKIQRVDDIPLAEEEAIEESETSGPEPVHNDLESRLKATSTQGLLQIGLDFVQAARQASELWLPERVLVAYGQPPADPATFPYWFASVLPISEIEKYALLSTTSVRERLKITARWISRLEAARSAPNRGPLGRTVIDESSEEENEATDAERENEAAGPDSANVQGTGPAAESEAEREADTVHQGLNDMVSESSAVTTDGSANVAPGTTQSTGAESNTSVSSP